MGMGKSTVALLALLLSAGCLAQNTANTGPLWGEPSHVQAYSNYHALQRAPPSRRENTFDTSPYVGDARPRYIDRPRAAEGPVWAKTGSGAHLVPPASPRQPYQKVCAVTVPSPIYEGDEGLAMLFMWVGVS